MIRRPDQRLRKTERLLKRGEFLDLSRQAHSTGNRYFVAAFKRNGLCFSRLGITVTRKTGKAVVRNRIKRLVREFFRQNRHLLTTGLDINVIAKKAAADATGGQVFSALRLLFERIGGHTN
ncbi:MAG: ribonuclease P protein component [Desulfobacteraceae bacterium]|nr:ribonuclease P protein component [Desulfobacteraceae bacterium]